jgi:PAS domain S-box-containing protein
MPDGLRKLTDEGTARHFLERLREGVYISTPAGEILDANPAFLSILGVSSLDELRGLNARDTFADPLERERWKAALDRHGSITDFPISVRRRDGEIRVLLDSAWTRVDPESGDLYYHGTVVDVTERQELETALEEQALRDPQTGCYNRRYLALASRDWEPRPAPWGCIVLEIDRSKPADGIPEDGTPDPVVNRMSRFLVRQSRAETAVVRTHSNEFLLLLHDADEKAVEAATERITFAAARELLAPFRLGKASRIPGEALPETLNRARTEKIEIPTAGSSPTRKPSGIYPLPAE